MSRNIEAILLDTGNTLRVVVKDPTFQSGIRQQLATLVGTEESPDAFYARLEEKYETYKKWAKDTQMQVTEEELWTRWLLTDHPAEKITPLAGKLTRLWIDRNGHRVPRQDTKSVIVELYNRGYVLGIIANSISRTEIPEWLEADGLTSYFKAVVLSSEFGWRKPDPSVYLEAARQAGVKPERCAYVGDNPVRDIIGSRSAGLGMVVILLESATLSKEPPKVKEKPDAIIRECNDLLRIFPPRVSPGNG